MVGDFVAFCIGVGGVRGESFVVCEFGIEADEEVVILEVGESVLEGSGGWKGGDVVEGCGCVECWDYQYSF